MFNRAVVPRQSQEYQQVLLCFPHVTRGVQQWLHSKNIQFVDPSGNAWIEGKNYKIWVEGRRPKNVPDLDGRQQMSRAFTATGLRAVFMLLVNQDLLEQPVRSLADAAGISVGAASNVLKSLEHEGFIRINGRRSFIQKSKLAKRWIEMYPVALKPKLRTRISAGSEPAEVIKRRDEWSDSIQLGGEVAMLAKGYGIRPVESLLYGGFPWGDVTHELFACDLLREETLFLLSGSGILTTYLNRM
ncbi:hypothetical protein [Rothia sp. ZJ932]|uniref:hypothetical protein n=1 Tax=Rothia sp. ZJ932 TaxID=2810516 RepID=UPI001967451D|nr:hypothetical protein [Rothia sp. ZJ932]QRZ62671.1 hypothetical protein JR346_01055 [Rothia sp. ZJ932]